jgi:hypothetical protein
LLGFGILLDSFFVETLLGFENQTALLVPICWSIARLH